MATRIHNAFTLALIVIASFSIGRVLGEDQSPAEAGTATPITGEKGHAEKIESVPAIDAGDVNTSVDLAPLTPDALEKKHRDAARLLKIQKQIQTATELSGRFAISRATVYELGATEEEQSPDEKKDHPEKNVFFGYPISKQSPLNGDAERKEVSGLMTDQENYATSGAMMCFYPGFAFRFENDSSSLNVLVCLRCRWVYVFDGKTWYHLPLSDIGIKAWTKEYATLFGAKK